LPCPESANVGKVLQTSPNAGKPVETGESAFYSSFTNFDCVASSVSRKDIVVVGTDAAVSTGYVVRYMTSYYWDATTVAVRSYSRDNEQTLRITP